MSLPDRDTLVYAGIGSRQTPDETLDDMTKMAGWLAKNGWHLSSGGADGADTAFANGATADQRSVFLPWKDYNKLGGPDCVTLNPSQLQNCMAVAERLHPTWDRCSQGARRLHARNAAILLGPNLDRPVNAVVAWTPGGAIKGGTGMGLRIAAEYNIPVLNLGSMTPRQACEQLQAMRETHLSAGADRDQTQTTQKQASPAPAAVENQANTYNASDVCGFRFTRDEWGAFSNFAPLAAPIAAGPWTFASSEHLYQAAKFGPSPDVQQQIANAPAARDAAALGRSSEGMHPDWNAQRIDVMRWIIRVKHEANPAEIGALLTRTGDKPIVEISTKDSFWGAKPQGSTLEGSNVLGRLWMELREQIRTNHPAAHSSAWTDRIDVGDLTRSPRLSQHAGAEQTAGATTTSTAHSRGTQDQQPREPAQAPRPTETHEPTIYNLKHDPDALKKGAIRIDRQTEWGNPFKIGEHGTRDEVIALYQKDLWKRIRSEQISLTDLAALNGKDMACHCSPKACHGDVLSRAATWAAAQIELKAQQQIPASQAPQHNEEPATQKATASQIDQTATPAAADRRSLETAVAPTQAPSASSAAHEPSIDQSPAYDLKQLLIAATHQDRQARAANIDTVLIPGREALALAAQQFIQDTDTTTLTPMQRMDLDGIIENQQRHIDCTKEIHDTALKLESSLQTYSDLEFVANGNGMEVSSLNAYEEWVIEARELSDQCHTSIRPLH